jgi:hypothetical protein
MRDGLGSKRRESQSPAHLSAGLGRSLRDLAIAVAASAFGVVPDAGGPGSATRDVTGDS